MADKPAVQIGENTAEYIAYRLMHEIMAAEKMSLVGGGDTKRVDRRYLLDSFAECMLAVSNPAGRRK